jgi:hypothetical protein
MEMPPDTLEAVGVNELFVAVTVDASFTSEQAVVGRIDPHSSFFLPLFSWFCQHLKMPLYGAFDGGDEPSYRERRIFCQHLKRQVSTRKILELDARRITKVCQPLRQRA